jgi:hypothetical protein
LKRIIPILLCSLLLFNILGYYLLFIGLKHQADIRIENQLDAGIYNGNETIVLKVPVDLPYQANWNTYERVNGDLFYQGRHYNAVKHRIYNDTMYTVYVQNNYKNHLYQKLNDLIGSFINVPVNSTNNSHIWNNLLNDYIKPYLQDHLNTLFILEGKIHSAFIFRLPAGFINICSPPPETFI